MPLDSGSLHQRPKRNKEILFVNKFFARVAGAVLKFDVAIVSLSRGYVAGHISTRKHSDK